MLKVSLNQALLVLSVTIVREMLEIFKEFDALNKCNFID